MTQICDSERKLSALFKIKQLEKPSSAYWEAFEAGLREKMIAANEPTKISLAEVFRSWMQQYRIAIASFAAATCAFAMLFSPHVTTHFTRSLPACAVSRCAHAISDAFELPKNFHNSTLAFSLPADNYSHYICNNMYKTRLNNAVKEVRF